MTRSLHNAILARYQGGHIYVDRSGDDPARELYLALDNIRDEDTATALANKYLDAYAALRVSDAIEGMVLDLDQVPVAGYTLGDQLGGKRLNAYTATLVTSGAGEGLTSVVPEFDDPFDSAIATLNRQIARAGAGLTSEYARPVITTQATGADTDAEPPEFSLSGPVVTGISPLWRAKRPWWGAWLDVSVEVADPVAPLTVVLGRFTAAGETGPSPATLIAVAAVTLAPGKTRGLARINEGWRQGRSLLMAVTSSAGTAQNLTASLRGTMV